MNILNAAKNIGIKHNVSIRVLDEVTGKVVLEHTGHNAATNSMLVGIGHYLTGDGILNQGYSMLSSYVPQYMSLGTMGLLNQNADSEGLPEGIGAVDYAGTKLQDLSIANLKLLGLVESNGDFKPGVDPLRIITDEENEILRYVDYMLQVPGFGADGYDANLNNGRRYFGLGPMFKDRDVTWVPGDKGKVYRGDINLDGKVNHDDLVMLLDYLAGKLKSELSEVQKIAADVNGDGVIDIQDLEALHQFLHEQEEAEKAGKPITPPSVEYDTAYAQYSGYELISNTFPRAMISYREVVPETASEIPETIDIIFSAMISTGALSQFREPGNNYLFITEAGLWSRPDWVDGGENGLLAGYRIAPPNEDNWDMTDPYNRDLLKSQILRVGVNQVVQVIWKIQIGAIEQLANISSLYPGRSNLEWKWIPPEAEFDTI